jgi:hypothetical protein
MFKIIGAHIGIKPTHHIISSGEMIGTVVAVGRMVDPNRVKVDDYIRFNPNYGIKFSYKGEPFFEMIDRTIIEKHNFVVIKDIQSLLDDKLCGGDNIRPFQAIP